MIRKGARKLKRYSLPFSAVFCLVSSYCNVWFAGGWAPVKLSAKEEREQKKTEKKAAKAAALKKKATELQQTLKWGGLERITEQLSVLQELLEEQDSRNGTDHHLLVGDNAFDAITSLLGSIESTGALETGEGGSDDSEGDGGEGEGDDNDDDSDVEKDQKE